MIHHLKIKKKYADAICAGAKPFEVREELFAIREFKAGDIVTFEVVDWDDYGHGLWEEHHTIEDRTYFIPYVLKAEDFPAGIKDGYCIFTIAQLSDELGHCYTHEMEERRRNE